jgi:hypothetical protein
MASHPTYNPNNLDAEGGSLATSLSAPLVNRATQGLYPIGTSLLPMQHAEFGIAPPSNSELAEFYKKLGFNQAPPINMPVIFDDKNTSPNDLLISPLQAALAAAALSHAGLQPAPRIAMAVDTPEQGWVVLPAGNQPVEVIQPGAADEAALAFIVEGKPYWSHIGRASANGNSITWMLAGTLPDWGGAPLVLVVALEENNSFLANHIGRSVLDLALNQ